MKVLLTPKAKADVAEARLWYRERGSGLDRRFLDAVADCVSAIAQNPEQGRAIEGAIRRILMRGFPFSLFYALYPDQAVVIACLHGARSPREWRRRIAR